MGDGKGEVYKLPNRDGSLELGGVSKSKEQNRAMNNDLITSSALPAACVE